MKTLNKSTLFLMVMGDVTVRGLDSTIFFCHKFNFYFYSIPFKSPSIIIIILPHQRQKVQNKQKQINWKGEKKSVADCSYKVNKQSYTQLRLEKKFFFVFKPVI